MLVLILIALAVLIGFVAGGSLRPFEHVRVHWWGAALVGVLLQALPFTSGLGTAAVIASYVLLVGFAVVNRRLPALWLVIAGLLLNLAVIGLNDGMPVSSSALRSAGADSAGLVGAGAIKHHLMRPDDVLTPLADVIGIPSPIGAVVSVGDLLLYLGIGILVVAIMLGRAGENRRPPSRLFPGYRGKHLPPERR
ncbi:MAG TPA: DUF5317 family protein, partial [Actinomycetota bacterium]|nr:DUF5317 family protein [Actinomycetota bacterium]